MLHYDQTTRLQSIFQPSGVDKALASLCQCYDPVTRLHVERVAALYVRFARSMGLPEALIRQWELAAYLHDVGKTQVPLEILMKPGALDAAEWKAVREHASYGYRLLRELGYPRLIQEIVLHHHESWDGSGYPDGICGKQIPLAARALAIVDVFDALTSDRPYRAGWTEEKTMGYLQAEAGKKFDPDLVKMFQAHMNRLTSPQVVKSRQGALVQVMCHAA